MLRIGKTWDRGVESMASEAENQNQILHLPLPSCMTLANYFTSVYLSFPICKLGKRRSSVLRLLH